MSSRFLEATIIITTGIRMFLFFQNMFNLSFYLFMYSCIYLLFVYLASTHVSIYLFLYMYSYFWLFIFLFVYRSIYLSNSSCYICLLAWLYIYLCIRCDFDWNLLNLSTQRVMYNFLCLMIFKVIIFSINIMPVCQVRESNDRRCLPKAEAFPLAKSDTLPW